MYKPTIYKFNEKRIPLKNKLNLIGGTGIKFFGNRFGLYILNDL